MGAQIILYRLNPNDLETLLIDAEKVEEIDRSDYIQDHLDLGHDWQALHYLFTGVEIGGTPPLAFAILAEYPFVHVHSQQHPVRYNHSVMASEIFQALETLSTRDFRQRYDAEKMRDSHVYPDHWGENEPEQELDQLTQTFIRLKTFYQHVHEHNDAVISRVVSTT